MQWLYSILPATQINNFVFVLAISPVTVLDYAKRFKGFVGRFILQYFPKPRKKYIQINMAILSHLNISHYTKCDPQYNICEIQV